VIRAEFARQQAQPAINRLKLASLSNLYQRLRENPDYAARGEVAQAVILDAERRNRDNKVQRLLLDSASTIHISTTKDGMCDISSCNKAVDSANKGRSWVKEDGTWKFRMVDDDSDLHICTADTHILEGFMNSRVSLPVLLKKGCKAVRCNQDLIRIRLPRKGHMDFVLVDDDLFYIT
jgi:hypothetical protein